MLSVSSRIWIRVAVSISYDDNHYTTGTKTPRLLHDYHKNFLNPSAFLILRNLRCQVMNLSLPSRCCLMEGSQGSNYHHNTQPTQRLCGPQKISWKSLLLMRFDWLLTKSECDTSSFHSEKPGPNEDLCVAVTKKCFVSSAFSFWAAWGTKP